MTSTRTALVRELIEHAPELVGLIAAGVDAIRASGDSDAIAKLDAAIAKASSRNLSAEVAAALDAEIARRGGL